MIPKIIHYCWFGGKEMPELVQRCIASWHQFMPDWQYMEWNENTLSAFCHSASLPSPLTDNRYCAEAYAAHKYAFVSDVVRLFVLEQFGGVYLDTDVEIIRSYEELPEFTHPAASVFMGFEDSLAHLPGTCVIGCEAHCQWVHDMLALYDNASFYMANGTMDTTTNVQRLGKIMVEQYGLIPNGEEQFIAGSIHVYNHHIFSPITSTRVMRKTKDTFSIHHFAGSWTGKESHWYYHPVFREMVNALVQIKRFIQRVI